MKYFEFIALWLIGSLLMGVMCWKGLPTHDLIDGISISIWAFVSGLVLAYIPKPDTLYKYKKVVRNICYILTIVCLISFIFVPITSSALVASTMIISFVTFPWFASTLIKEN